MNQLLTIAKDRSPALVAAAGPQAQTRFAEFFVNNIRNVHTRRAYARAVGEFLVWCEEYGVASIADVQPLHVGTYIELLTRDPHLSAPTIKQKLAAIRMMFDWLVTGHVVNVNPAGSVRGPTHIVKRGKTPVLDPAEARTLIDAIDVLTPIGLRDRSIVRIAATPTASSLHCAPRISHCQIIPTHNGYESTCFFPEVFSYRKL